MSNGELEQYRTSYKANIACKEVIEQAIADHYRDNRLGMEAVHQVLEQFGYDRNVYFVVDRSHPGLTDLFVTQLQMKALKYDLTFRMWDYKSTSKKRKGTVSINRTRFSYGWK